MSIRSKLENLKFASLMINGVKTAGEFAAKNALVMGVAGTVGVAGVIQSNTINGRINSTQEQIEQVAQGAEDELKPLIIENQTNIRDSATSAANKLRETADLLTIDIVQVQQEAEAGITEAQEGIEQAKQDSIDAIKLAADEAAKELEEASSNLELTDQEIQQILVTNVTTITAQIAALELADQTVITDLTLLITQLDQRLQGQLDSVPPIGSLSWVVDPSLVNTEFYAPCDGANINGNILPNINANNLFVRGGSYTGITSPDTTAVNGLGISSEGSHSHTIGGGGQDYLFFTQTPGGDIPTGNISPSIGIHGASGTILRSGTDTNGAHTHTITGDSETAPTHITAVCFVRVK